LTDSRDARISHHARICRTVVSTICRTERTAPLVNAIRATSAVTPAGQPTAVYISPDAMKERGLLAPRNCPGRSCSGCLRRLRRPEGPCGSVRRPADRGHGPAPPPVAAGEDEPGRPEAGHVADHQQPLRRSGGRAYTRRWCWSLQRLVMGGGRAGDGRRRDTPGAPAVGVKATAGSRTTSSGLLI
jgi:hypothetical protein